MSDNVVKGPWKPRGPQVWRARLALTICAVVAFVVGWWPLGIWLLICAALARHTAKFWA